MDRLLARLVPRLGWLYLQFVGKTSRIDVRRAPSAQALLDGTGPCVFAFWHRYQLLMAYEHRHRGVNVLVSRSKDGELIAGALHRFGFQTARGSSTRGGAAALMALLDRLERGERVAVTPDGPKGPFRSVQPGVAALAQKSGAPVVPIGWAGTQVKALPSWDRFLVPMPFGRYVVFFGEPLAVAPDDPAPEGRIQAALDAAADEAERLLKEAP